MREASSSLKEEAPTVTSQTNPPVKDQTNPTVEEPPVQNAKTVTVSEQCRNDLETALTPKVTEMLSDVLESIESTAISVRFRCVGVGEPSQAETKEPEETSNLQPEEPVQETEELIQKSKEAVHSNDYYIFTRLVEAEGDEGVTPAENTEAVEQAVPKDTGEETVEEKPTEDTTKEKEKPGKVKPEAPVFPTTEALKTLIEGLNKAGSPFETDLAVYTLRYTLEDTDIGSLSFDILVESEKTSPKEGFWKSFGKALKAHLKKAGTQIARDLAGDRGHMN